MSGRPFAWERSYPPGVRWDEPIRESTIASLLDRATARTPDKSAIEFRGVTLTFADLAARADTAAAGFLSLGLGHDQPLALYLPNTPFHPIAFFGGAKTGAPLVHLSPLDAERELAHKIIDSGARTVVTTNIGALLAKAMKLLDAGLIDRVIIGDDAEWGPSPGSPPLVPIPDREGVLRLSELMARASPPPQWPEIAPGDIALLQYTGGTTGVPKGAVLTHGNLTAAVAIYDAWNNGQGLSRPGRDIAICVLPLFHIYALTTILLRNVGDSNLILLRPKFDPDQTLHDIEVKRATLLPGVPTMWIALAHREDIARRDLSSLTYLGSGGAPLPVEIADRFAELTGRRLGGGWGMTETSPAGTHIPRYGSPTPGTIGLPLPNVEMGVVALDDPHRALPAGEIGELRVRGPNVTRGYWKRPEETQKAFAAGYFLTGDIGWMDADGFFYLVDRKKDMIISGGFNVYPQMIEQAIYEHPAVEEVLVIGLPDPYRGEAAKAFVKLKPGHPAFTLAELKEFLADKIGRHEMPTDIEFRDALPRTAVGKLSKIELRQQERDKLAAASSNRD